MIGRWTLLDPEIVRRPVPANLRAGDDGLFVHEYQRRIEAAVVWDTYRVIALPNGFLLKQGRILREGFSAPPRTVRVLKAGLRAAQHLLSTRAIRVDRGLWITDEYSNGYFHWVCDVLPRLEALGTQGCSGRTLVIPAMADQGYVEESLEPYGLGQVQVLSWRDRAFCRQLRLVGAVAPTGNYRPELMRALRERMRSHFGVEGGSRRIYISRAGASFRRIANETEILPLLERFGFQSVRAEHLSFSEQIRVIGSASVLVSNHGAGLTHQCWMKPGTTVLELRRAGDRIDNCYYALAGALGITYRYQACRAVDDRLPTHAADLVVDLRQLAAELETVA